MRTSGLFQTAQRIIELDGRSDCFWLSPFSDVHVGHPQHARSEWLEYLRWVKETPNAYIIGNGDYWEWYRAHTRAAIKNAVAKEEHEAEDRQHERAVKEFAKQLMPFRDRIIGLGDGNHTWEFVNGQTSEQLLAKELDVPHLGVSCVVNFIVRSKSSGGQTSFLYAQHHGKSGGGHTPGAPYNAVANWAKAFHGVTIYVMGDDHSRGFIRGKPKMAFFSDRTTGRLLPREVPQFYCRSGCFKKVYEPGHCSYEIDRGYGATDIGAIRFKIQLKRSERKGLHLDFEGHV